MSTHNSFYQALTVTVLVTLLLSQNSAAILAGPTSLETSDGGRLFDDLVVESVKSPETTLLYDHFDTDGYLNPDLWYFQTNGNSSWSINDSTLIISSGTVNGAGGWVHSQQQFTPGAETLSLETRTAASAADGGYWGFYENDGGSTSSVAFSVDPSNGDLRAQVYVDSGGVSRVAIPGIDVTAWHTYRIEIVGSTANFYVDDVLKVTHTENVPQGKAMHIRLDRVSWGQNQTSSTDYVKLWRGELASFFDDFNDGNADGWNPVTGTWAVLTDVPSIPYAQTSDPGGSGNIFVTFYTGSQFTDFEIGVDITSTSSAASGSFNVGVALRGDGSSNYYRVIFHPSWSGGGLRVEKIVDGTRVTIVPNTDFDTPPASNTLKVVAQGNTFSAFVNDVFVTSWTDNTFSTGFIGLTTENGSANFDNVRVTTDGPPDTGTIQGRVVDASTWSGIEGALIQAGTYATTTGTDGRYSLIVHPGGEYHVTARKSGYYTNNARATVALGETASVNFELSSRTGTGFGVWIGKPSLAGASDQQVEDILLKTSRNGGSIVYFPAYHPITSITETISGTFLFTGTVPWNGTVTDTHISFNPSYTYSLSNLVTTAHSDTLKLKVYASIPCFSTGGDPEQYIIPDAPASDDRLWPHLRDVAQYLLQYDVDGIVLDFVRYPSIEEGPPEDTRVTNITEFVAYMRFWLSETELVVTTWSPTLETRRVRGQDLRLLAGVFPDAISPQLYAGRTYTNYEGDLQGLTSLSEESHEDIGANSQYIPVLQAYDSITQTEDICEPGGKNLLAALEALGDFDNFAVFRYGRISSELECANDPDGPEWPVLNPFPPQPKNAAIIGTVTGTAVTGRQETFQFVNEAVSELVLTVHWSGGESAGATNETGGVSAVVGDVLRVQVYKPGGTLYGTFDLTDSTEVITIPGAEPGTWECKVTTTSAVHQRYAIVAGAVTNQVYLPMVLKNH